MLVIEGLKGKPVADIGTEHQGSHSPYSHWRDQLLAHAAKAFERQQSTPRAARLAQENTRLKPRVGELALELKKSDALLA